jgi:type IV pilus assembly protein PilQ
MNKLIKRLLILLLFTIFHSVGIAQTRIDSLSIKLDSLSLQIKGLNQNLDLSVSNLPLKEFVRNVANLTNLNINLEDDLNQQVTNNFVGVPAKDILLFLCRVYSLELTFTGNIIQVKRFVKDPVAYVPKEVKVYYDSVNKLLTLDLKNDSLYLVARKLTEFTKINIVYANDIGKKRISGYILNLDLKSVLEKLAISNSLKIEEIDDAFVINIEAVEAQVARSNGSRQNSRADFQYKINDKEHIDIQGVNVDVGQAIEQISKKLNVNYFIDTEIKANTNLNLVNVSYDDFLTTILQRTAYSYMHEDSIYFVGKKDAEGLRVSKVIQLMNRSVIKLSEVIPDGIKKDMGIKEFPNLNSLIVSGPSANILELERFLLQIDKVVPLILIEVLIIDNQSNYTVSTGIEAGMSSEPVESGGKIFPGVDFTLSSQSINKLLNSFNGFGVLNLGNVNPNFYASIKALEESGLIKVRSTPKLATLNGQEASLTIGNTEYYLEERTDFIINTTTQQRTSSQYKAVNADFKISILPIVAGNKEITLNITVEQSDFTARISTEAPPGQISRNFTSSVRVKNNEMILLGGLEEKSNKETNSGVPLLSRIPILKWIFSSKTNESKTKKLNIFVKSTVIY